MSHARQQYFVDLRTTFLSENIIRTLSLNLTLKVFQIRRKGEQHWCRKHQTLVVSLNLT